MRDSTISRLRRLALDLARSPAELTRYVRYSSTFSRKAPVDWRLPWIAFRAIDLLERFVRPGCRVLEWGCGGSTLYFADRGCHVLSIEHEPEWASIVHRKLTPDQRERVEIQIHDAPTNIEAYRTSTYVSSPLGQLFDLVLVDGFTDYHGAHRNLCFETAERVIGANALILLDDSWMFPPINNSNAVWIRTLAGVGPARSGVTTTDVYAYGGIPLELSR